MWQRIRNRLYFTFLVGYMIVDATSSVAYAAIHVQANICGYFAAPTITSPASNETSQNSTITIAGSGEPNMAVSIVDNGTIVGMTTATIGGTYALDTPLNSGTNTITAIETDSCGSSKQSGTVSITYQAPSTPQNPSGQGATPSTQQSISSSVSVLPFVPISVPHALQQLTPPTSNTTGYPKPVITRPIEGSVFQVHQIWVTGRAQVGSIVTLFVNGHGVARINVSPSGIFGALVGLTSGKNTIEAVARQGSQVAASDTIDVHLIEVATVYPSSSTPATVAKVALMGAAVTIPVAGVSIWTIHRIHFGVRKK